MANTKDNDAEVKPAEVNHRPNGLHNYQHWLAPVLLVVIVLLLVGVVAVRHQDDSQMGSRHEGGFRTMRHQRGNLIREDRLANNQSHLAGTVTAINGSSFTLAGGGATNQVDTNSSTQYQGSSQVKVNDTVIASGTTNNATFTASEVVVNP